MDWQNVMSSEKMSLAAVIIASASLFLSLTTAFPQIKGAIIVIRDVVLWLALCAVAGGVGYVFYCQYQQKHDKNEASSRQFSDPVDHTRMSPLPAAPPLPPPPPLPVPNEPMKPRAAIRESDIT